jgi:hypothetical protein
VKTGETDAGKKEIREIIESLSRGNWAGKAFARGA